MKIQEAIETLGFCMSKKACDEFIKRACDSIDCLDNLEEKIEKTFPEMPAEFKEALIQRILYLNKKK